MYFIDMLQGVMVVLGGIFPVFGPGDVRWEPLVLEVLYLLHLNWHGTTRWTQKPGKNGGYNSSFRG